MSTLHECIDFMKDCVKISGSKYRQKEKELNEKFSVTSYDFGKYKIQDFFILLSRFLKKMVSIRKTRFFNFSKFYKQIAPLMPQKNCPLDIYKILELGMECEFGSSFAKIKSTLDTVFEITMGFYKNSVISINKLSLLARNSLDVEIEKIKQYYNDALEARNHIIEAAKKGNIKYDLHGSLPKIDENSIQTFQYSNIGLIILCKYIEVCP